MGRGTKPYAEHPVVGPVFLTRHYIERLLERFELADPDDPSPGWGWTRARTFGCGIIRTASFIPLWRRPQCGKLVLSHPGDLEIKLRWGDWTVPCNKRSHRAAYHALTIHPSNPEENPL